MSVPTAQDIVHYVLSGLGIPLAQVCLYWVDLNSLRLKYSVLGWTLLPLVQDVIRYVLGGLWSHWFIDWTSGPLAQILDTVSGRALCSFGLYIGIGHNVWVGLLPHWLHGDTLDSGLPESHCWHIAHWYEPECGKNKTRAGRHRRRSMK